LDFGSFPKGPQSLTLFRSNFPTVALTQVVLFFFLLFQPVLLETTLLFPSFRPLLCPTTVSWAGFFFLFPNPVLVPPDFVMVSPPSLFFSHPLFCDPFFFLGSLGRTPHSFFMPRFPLWKASFFFRGSVFFPQVSCILKNSLLPFPCCLVFFVESVFFYAVMRPCSLISCSRTVFSLSFPFVFHGSVCVLPFFGPGWCPPPPYFPSGLPPKGRVLRGRSPTVCAVLPHSTLFVFLIDRAFYSFFPHFSTDYLLLPR